MSVPVRFVVILVVALFIAGGFAAYDGVATLAIAEVADEWERDYLLTTWLLTFFRHFPLVVASAAIITFSVAVGPLDMRITGTLISAARPVIVLVVALGVVYGIWVGVIGPRQHVRIEGILYRSRVARTAWDDARQARDTGNLHVAQRYAEIYLSVMGPDDEVQAFLNDVRGEINTRRTSMEMARFGPAGDMNDEGERFPDARALTVAELLERARRYYDDGNYFSAHYFATRAVEMSDGRRDARVIQSRALNAIEGESFDIQDDPARDLFRDKIDAYQLLTRGSPEENPEALVLAFFRFQELLQRAPDDPDIKRFSAAAEEQVRGISFFVEDARLYGSPSYTSRNDVFFQNRHGGDISEFIAADRLVQSPVGDFMYDVEVYRYTADGYLHFHADYAKWIEGNLFFRAIERDKVGSSDEGRIHNPVRLGGDGEIPGYIPIVPDVEEIILLSTAGYDVPTVALPDLMGLPALFREFGRSEATAINGAAQRIMALIGFFILTFGSVALAWHYRSAYLERPPVFALAVLPLIPLLLWWAREVPKFLLSLLVNGLALRLDGGGVVTAVFGVFLAVLVGTVMYLAKRRVEP